jgi:hypothetical protein
MPTVILQGGLGNQLFQYAVGRSLSLKTGSQLYLEESKFAYSSDPGLPTRTFRLSEFAVQGDVIRNPIEEDALLKGRFRLFSILSKITPKLAGRISGVHKDLERPRCFTPHVLGLSGNAYLYGYYQSEKYFRSIEETLREELSLQRELDGINREWRYRVEEEESVSIHVRRSDYVDQEWDLPVGYYRSAIEEICRTNGSVQLFFFSDDVEWVRENRRDLLPKDVTHESVSYVDCNGTDNAHKDLWLMKSCSHNIISNSTFSWWGAWLNQNKEKKVLAPAYWLRDRVENLDIIPDRWKVVDW